MSSSQALAQSLFGNLIAHGGLGVLADIATESGEPLVGVRIESAKLEHAVDYLGEMQNRETNIDVLLHCAGGYRVAFECKLRETEIGHCSRPSVAKTSAIAGRQCGWLANLRVLEIEEIKSVPYAPVSHPFVERLIGTIRREYLDRTFFWNAVDLARKLEDFRDYYNVHRVHRSLDGNTPAQADDAPSPTLAKLDSHAWQQHCRGLFQTPIAA